MSEPLRIYYRQPHHGHFTTEYRSAIFYNSPSQKDTAQKVTKEVQNKHFDPHGAKITTQIVEAGKPFDAEDHH